MQQQHLVLLGMALVVLNRQAWCLEPPLGSSLAAKEVMYAPGEVAIHLCLMANAHLQEILQAWRRLRPLLGQAWRRLRTLLGQ